MTHRTQIYCDAIGTISLLGELPRRIESHGGRLGVVVGLTVGQNAARSAVELKIQRCQLAKCVEFKYLKAGSLSLIIRNSSQGRVPTHHQRLHE